MSTQECSGLEKVVARANQTLQHDAVILGNLENKLQALKRRPIADPAQLAEVQQEVKTAQEKVDTDQRTVEAAERALYDCETGIDKPPVQP